MTDNAAEVEREIRSEQSYLDWALECLDAELERCENGPWHAEGSVDNALRRMREAKADQLRVARRALLIGRLDMSASSEVAGTWYIGHTDVADTSYDTVVTDWRSELGGRFYQAGHGAPLDVARRRTFQTEGNAITAISHETLIPTFELGGGEEPQAKSAALVGRSSSPEEDGEKTQFEGLRARDLLLAELERERTTHMHEIVTTIQADQDRLIRHDPSSPLIVQGGPGTGKTVVGLHRAAYLLYKQREGSLQQSMLIVGPNSTFMEYIGAVLPTLGETNARQLTTEALLMSAQSDADQRMLRNQLRAHESDEVARVKGSPIMAVILKRAVWSHSAPAGVSASFRAMRAELDVHQVHAIIEEFAQTRSYNDARKQIEARLARALTDAVVASAAAVGRTLFTPEVEEFSKAAAEQLRRKQLRNSLLPAVKAPKVLDRLLSDSTILDKVAVDLLAEHERLALYRSKSEPAEGRGWQLSIDDLALLDEIASVVGAEVERFDHLIVDEAQDLSPMMWRAMKRRARLGGITVLGDLAQGTAVWSPDSWQEVQDMLGYTDIDMVQELRLGYRVPKPILDYAARLLPVAAPDVVRPESFREGEEPYFHRVGASDVWDTALDLVGSAGGRSVLIVPDDLVEPMMERAGVSVDDALGSLTVLSPDGVKGLEFDQVIVLEPAQLVSRDQRGFRQLYVALTRSTKRLDIVHVDDLPTILDDQLPDDFNAAAGASEEEMVWVIGTETASLPVLAPLLDPPQDMPDLRPSGNSDEVSGRDVSTGPTVSPEHGSAVPAAWFEDPLSRFAYRYWDGAQWTGWVASASGAVAAELNPIGLQTESE